MTKDGLQSDSDFPLSGRELVRCRPKMWIISTDEWGLRELLWAIFAHSLDEYRAGAGDQITLSLNSDGSATVIDYGRGIPVTVAQDSKSGLEDAFTTLRPGVRYTGSLKVSSFPYPLRLFVVNALSSRLVVEVKRNGYLWRQEYKDGEPLANVARSEKVTDTGTSITFWPDPAIWGDSEFSLELVCKDMREVCYLNPNLTVQVIDARSQAKQIFTYHFPDGLISYVQHLNSHKTTLHKPISIDTITDTIETHFALQYNSDNAEDVRAYVNNFYTADGGPHLIGFKEALIRVLDELGHQTGILPVETSVRPFVSEGLCAVISIWLAEPWFKRANLTELANEDVMDKVSDAVTRGLMAHFEVAPRDFEVIMGKVQRNLEVSSNSII